MKTSFVFASKMVLSAAVLGIMLSACSSESSFEKESEQGLVFDLSGEVVQNQQQTLVPDENNPGNYYTRIDSVAGYGFGLAHYLPDSLKNTALKIIISGKMRDSESLMGYIATSIHGKENALAFFANFPSNKYLREPNVWTVFKDSIIIPADKNTFESQILKVFTGKQVGSGFFDVDDLKIEIKKGE